MIKKATPCSCVPDLISSASQSFDRIASHQTGFKIFIYTACAALCLVMSVPAASANVKDRHSKSSRAEERPRRVADKKAEKKAEKTIVSKREAANKRENRRESFSRRENFSRRETFATKRGLLMTREPQNKREGANRVASLPNVRKTSIISATQPNNSAATRPSLVNDIVIVSLAEEAPVTSRLPVQPKISGSASSKLLDSSNPNMPSIWPVAGTFAKSGFGIRRNPFGGMSTEFHKGQDISAPYGAPVIATADGVVMISGWLRGYGQVVYIDHGNGISTRYGHLSRLDVTVGQVIKRGQQLGLVGSTGRSTGPHLHYEVRLDGQATNPVPYLPELPAPVLANKPGIQ